MVTKLWDKGYELDPRVERFEISDDLVYDQRLVVADALGSIGHAAGLAKAGLLPVKTFHALRKELAHIVELAEAGALALTEKITVRSVAGEKHDRIVAYELGPLPEPVACESRIEEEAPF